MMPRFPAVILGFLLSFPLLASIRGGPEHELTARQLDLAASNQDEARIASDGTSFLSVWSDYNNNVILGARLAPNGALLDTTPLTIGEGGHPSIAWGRDRYLVTWEGFGTIRGRFVAPDGTMSPVIDLGPHVTYDYLAESKVAFNGRVFLVLWYDSMAAGQRIDRGAILDTDGRVTTTREIVRSERGTENALVAMQGTFYYMYATQNRLIALPVDETAQAGVPMEIAKATASAFRIRAAARNDDFAVAWTDSYTIVGEIRFVRVTRNGAEPAETAGPELFLLYDIVADRSGYLVLYGDDIRTFARRAGSSAPAFTVRTPPPNPFARVQAAASSSARTIAVIQHGAVSYDLSTSILGEDVVAPLALGPRQQQSPDIAAAGELKLVVWREAFTADNRSAVLAMRVDANGNAIDIKPIDTGGSSDGYTNVRVASDGAGWLVVWQRVGDIEGMRIRHDGTRIDSSPVLIATQARSESLAVSWDGQRYVVVFTRGGLFRVGLRTEVYASRVPASGEPLPAIRISETAWNQQVAIASGPSGSLIVWSNYESLAGALLSPTDTVTPLAFPQGHGRRAAVAWNGDTFLVAASTWQPELRLLRVDANGNIRESFATVPMRSGTFSPNTVIEAEPFGDAFLLLWNDGDLDAAIVTREGFVAEGPAVAGRTISTYGLPGFAASGSQVVSEQTISHPTRPSRLFLQSIEWTHEPAPRRRSAR